MMWHFNWRMLESQIERLHAAGSHLRPHDPPGLPIDVEIYQRRRGYGRLTGRWRTEEHEIRWTDCPILSFIRPGSTVRVACRIGREIAPEFKAKPYLGLAPWDNYEAAL